MTSPETDPTQAGKDAPDLNKTIEMSAAELAAARTEAPPTAAAPPTGFAAAKLAAARTAILTAAKVASGQAAPAGAASAPMTFSQAFPAGSEEQVQLGSEERVPAESAGDAPVNPAAAPTAPAAAHGLGFSTKRRRAVLLLLVCAAAVPLMFTLAGALTAPPRVAGLPSGQLITLQADPASAAHRLLVTGPGGASRLLARDEPQAKGRREQITQPTLSPDGTQLAFEKQVTIVHSGAASTDNQIWVMPMTPNTDSPPHLVLDLTRRKLKQIAGLAWDSDSSLLFLEDGVSYSVATETDDAPLVTPLALPGLTLANRGDVSATGSPVLTESGTFAYAAQTPSGPQVLTQNREHATLGPAAAVFALSPTGNPIAFVPPDSPGVIRRFDLVHRSTLADIPVHWRWSLFGHRQITSLRWSPGGSQIACTVSKSSGGDDELFLVTPATGQTVQLPYHTAPDAWDWGK